MRRLCKLFLLWTKSLQNQPSKKKDERLSMNGKRLDCSLFTLLLTFNSMFSVYIKICRGTRDRCQQFPKVYCVSVGNYSTLIYFPKVYAHLFCLHLIPEILIMYCHDLPYVPTRQSTCGISVKLRREDKAVLNKNLSTPRTCKIPASVHLAHLGNTGVSGLA